MCPSSTLVKKLQVWCRMNIFPSPFKPWNAVTKFGKGGMKYFRQGGASCVSNID